jgi:hypothetical protein
VEPQDPEEPIAELERQLSEAKVAASRRQSRAGGGFAEAAWLNHVASQPGSSVPSYGGQLSAAPRKVPLLVCICALHGRDSADHRVDHAARGTPAGGDSRPARGLRFPVPRRKDPDGIAQVGPGCDCHPGRDHVAGTVLRWHHLLKRRSVGGSRVGGDAAGVERPEDEDPDSGTCSTATRATSSWAAANTSMASSWPINEIRRARCVSPPSSATSTVMTPATGPAGSDRVCRSGWPAGW